MQYDRNKLKAVVAYVCASCNPVHLGTVKLHKVLYFSDMLHYIEFGRPLTGSTYRKRPHGPTCESLVTILHEMQVDGLLSVHEVDYFGYRKREFHVSADAEFGVLSSAELILLDEVIEFVCRNNTAKTISEFSHNKAWESAEFGDIIPYVSAYDLVPDEVSYEALEWARAEAGTIEAARSSKDPLGGVDYRTFRARILESGSVL